MALRLTELGYRSVFALRGGMQAWLDAGLPDEPKDAGIAVESAPDAPEPG